MWPPLAVAPSPAPAGYGRNCKPPAVVDDLITRTVESFPGGVFVRDIYEVLRKKQAEQAQLGKQIEALQTAAEQLRNVAHLLNAEEEEQDSKNN
jgi:hypothetical protein